MAPDSTEPARQWYAKEFARNGWVDGSIQIMVLRPKSWEDGDVVATMRQAISFRPEVIVSHLHGPMAKKLVLPLTRDIPLVLFGVDDDSRDSIVMLNRRGENVTGAVYSFREMVAQRLVLMKQLRPQSKRAAIVSPQLGTGNEEEARRELAALGRVIGVEAIVIDLPKEVSGEALARAARDARIDIVEMSAFWEGREYWEALAAHGIAASGVGAVSARDGALLGGWSGGYTQTAVRLAAKILRGEKAAALPVERPMEYGLAINLRTARVLGITVPPSVLVRAHQVFE